MRLNSIMWLLWGNLRFFGTTLFPDYLMNHPKDWLYLCEQMLVGVREEVTLGNTTLSSSDTGKLLRKIAPYTSMQYQTWIRSMFSTAYLYMVLASVSRPFLSGISCSESITWTLGDARCCLAFSSTWCSRMIGTVFEKNIKKYETKSNSDFNMCNILLDMSATFPINFTKI